MFLIYAHAPMDVAWMMNARYVINFMDSTMKNKMTPEDYEQIIAGLQADIAVKNKCIADLRKNAAALLSQPSEDVAQEPVAYGDFTSKYAKVYAIPVSGIPAWMKTLTKLYATPQPLPAQELTDERIIDLAMNQWNADVDIYNTWDVLGFDEKAGQIIKVCKSLLSGTKP
jgi:hypothetical protein